MTGATWQRWMRVIWVKCGNLKDCGEGEGCGGGICHDQEVRLRRHRAQAPEQVTVCGVQFSDGQEVVSKIGSSKSRCYCVRCAKRICII